ncbi:MAG: hypothetical protein AAGI68_13065 [Planctomycetota bacterium]
MPPTADTTRPETPWLDLLNRSVSGGPTLDLGQRIRRLAEHAAAEHLAATSAADPRVDQAQTAFASPYPSPQGRHGRQPLALDIPESPRDYGTAAKECG